VNVTHHSYYGDPSRLDLQVIRDQALRRAVKGMWPFADDKDFPPSVIHHHKWQESCSGKKHELIESRTGEITETTEYEMEV
jgi:hypothetical protein